MELVEVMQEKTEKATKEKTPKEQKVIVWIDDESEQMLQVTLK